MRPSSPKPIAIKLMIWSENQVKIRMYASKVDLDVIVFLIKKTKYTTSLKINSNTHIWSNT